MPVSSSPPSPSPHHLAILMSGVGRFLECRDCLLSFEFPEGAKFGTIAKQFESLLCSAQILIPAWRADPHFVIVRYEGRVPAMASCARCERKFFTPPALASDAVGAEEYLGHKFDLHHCGEPQK